MVKLEEHMAYREPRRVEFINGQPVLMPPCTGVDHSYVRYNIANIFYNYLKGKSCVPFCGGTDLHLMKGDIFVPDFMVVCNPEKIKADGVYGVPDLIAEVCSPGTAKRDLMEKKNAYEKYGVREYWIVDPGEKRIEVYLLHGGAYRLDEVYSVYPEWMLERMTEEERSRIATEFKCSLFDGLSIRLEDVFYRVK